MLRLVVLSLMLVTSGCQPSGSTRGTASVGGASGGNTVSTFEPYISTFYRRMGQAGLGTARRKIKFVMDKDMPPMWAGTCQVVGTADGNPEIRISQRYWSTGTPQYKELLIFHEMGHCVLDRDHEDGFNSFGRARSIMHSGGHPLDTQYSTYYGGYMAELFGVSASRFSNIRFVPGSGGGTVNAVMASAVQMQDTPEEDYGPSNEGGHRFECVH